MRLSPLFVGCCFYSCLSAPSPVQAAERPNVLLLVADDLRSELGCLGAEHVHSPHLDQLASRSRIFARAYCQQAVCNPSRASFLTGLRPNTLQVWDLRSHFRKGFPTRPTLPQLFKNNGYQTRCIGKIYHNSEKLGDPPSWSAPAELHAGPHWSDTVAARRGGAQGKSQTPAFESFDVPDDDYWDGRIAARACTAIEQLAGSEQPFFLAVGFWRPHLPFVAPTKDWQKFDPNEVMMPKSQSAPLHAPPIALHDSRELKGYQGVPAFPLDETTTRQLRHGYYASIAFMDRQVGKVLAALKATKAADNTIVVFLSDHGFHLGEHGLWCKTSCYEWDARVPLMISVPKLANPGVASHAIVELVDLYPTLAELAELPAVNKTGGALPMDGVSLVSVLADPKAVVKESAFTQHPRPAYTKEPASVMGISVRSKNYRYTEWRNRKTGMLVGRELYDHQNDPGETRNQAEEAHYASVANRLASQLAPHFRTDGP